MEEDYTQREEPKQEGTGDVRIGKKSRCALYSQRFSVNIYQYLFSVIPTGNDLAFFSVNAEVQQAPEKIAGGWPSLPRALIMCSLTSLKTC